MYFLSRHRTKTDSVKKNINIIKQDLFQTCFQPDQGKDIRKQRNSIIHICASHNFVINKRGTLIQNESPLNCPSKSS